MNRRFERLAAYSWRVVVIAAAIAIVVWLTGQLLIVVVPLAVAGIATRALWPINRVLRERRVPPGIAAALSLLFFLLALGAALGLAGFALAGQADDLGPTIRAGVDDMTDWLVDDSPFDVRRSDVEGFRSDVEDSLSSVVRSGGGLANGAIVAAEIAAGSLLAMMITFFVLKDASGWATNLIGRLPPDRRDLADRAMHRGWSAVGGYLRGASILGAVEAAAIGLAMLFVGAELIAPVMLLTFLAAFVPIVGAVVAGAAATLVTFATAGTIPALIVAGIALVVQQLDNDVLGPVVYGRALRLHPLIILIGIAAGGSLFGLVGTLFAVPFLAVTLNVLDEWRQTIDDVSGNPVDGAGAADDVTTAALAVGG